MKISWGRRAIVLAIGVTLSATFATPTRASSVQSQALGASAASALSWIEKELTASGHRFQVTFNENKFDDIGLTIDGVLALTAGGRGANAEAKAASDYVVAHAADYATGGQFAPADRYAGPLGKLMVMAVARNISTTMGTLNLETEIRNRMQTTGASAGRFSDLITDTQFGSDFSNGVGDALDVIALSSTTLGVPAVALTWLIAQQCDNGGFRISYDTGTSCTANTQADLDATSFALMALAASEDDSDATVDAFEDGLNYLLDQQTDNGSFGAGNGNSTGLAASVVRGVGDAPDANKAAAFITSTLQLTSGADAGAIALNKAGADTAKASGLTPTTRETFERATPQAVFALGLPSYIDIGATPVEPATTASLSSSTVTIGSPVTATGQGFLAGEKVDFVLQSDPINVGSANASSGTVASLTFNAPAAAGPGAHTLKLTGSVSGATVSVPLTLTAALAATTTTAIGAPATTTTTVRVLARSGNDSGGQSGFAVGLILLGGGLVLAARKRRIIYPFKR